MHVGTATRPPAHGTPRAPRVPVGCTPYSFQQIRGSGPLSISSRGESMPHTPRALPPPSPGDSPHPPAVPKPQPRLPGPPPSQRASRWPRGPSRARAPISGSHPTAAGFSPLRGKTRHAARKVGARLRPAPNSRGVHLALQPLGLPRRSPGWHHLPRAGERAPRAGRGGTECAPPPITSPPAFWAGGAQPPRVGAPDAFRAPKGLLTARPVQLSFGSSRRRRLSPPPHPGSFLAPPYPPTRPSQPRLINHL